MIKIYTKYKILSLVKSICKLNKAMPEPYIVSDFYDDIVITDYKNCKIYGNLNDKIVVNSNSNKDQDLDQILKQFLMEVRQRIINQESM